MDDSSFNDVDDSLMKTINLPKQAFSGYQEDVSANSETACKVSTKQFFIFELQFLFQSLVKHLQVEMIVKMQDDLASIGVKKALPFTKFLNYQLNKLRGSGVLQNALAVPMKNCPQDDNLMPITFHKMIFLFTVFVLGGTLSIIIFIVERAVSNKKLEKMDGSAITLASRGQGDPDCVEIEKRTEVEIGNVSLVKPPEFQSFLQNWMESDATRSKEEFLELVKLEVDAILHRAS